MWLYLAQADPNLNGQTPNLVQGKCLGGGSGVNAMLYCRGAASVFDEWAEISGNKGLRWDSMLESFKATTHWTDEPSINYKQPINTSAFGNGPLEISRQRELLTFDNPFADKLAAQFNLPEIDFASGGGIGVSQGIGSIRASNRTRSYAYNTFGYLANNRPNFELHHDALVSKIGFTHKTADSVTYNDTLTGTVHTIHAKEIIVAAGAINSPQLLMLSGVGPADRLQELNIPVVKDIPEVGRNLYDHHYAVLQYAAIPEADTVWQWHDNATRAAIERARYGRNGDGMLGTNDGDVIGALRLPDSVFEGKGSFHTNLPADRPHMIYEYTTTPFLPDSPNISIIAAFVAVVQPESKGYVTLASADYRDAPLIYTNYWGSESDKAAILYGYKELRATMRSDELKRVATTELFPGPDVTSDEAIWAAIQQSSQSWHHPVGTTALGTVLDANWRVKGVKGLRVVGSSAAPTITTCGTQSMAYAIGHRAALDIVAADHV
jgi:choline dehydrogenase